MRFALFRLLLALPCATFAALPGTTSALADPPKGGRERSIARICDLIEANARLNDLPEAFFARLIWKESRFDANAVSPAGAEGIAQFMPGTARLRGLADPFDPEQAIPASAKYLGELRREYGSVGLAAAAYNAGEGRVARWLGSGGFLPLETEAYVLDITGVPADSLLRGAEVASLPPLDPKRGFQEACRKLPALLSSTVPMASITRKPWGVQVAGNFRRSAAVEQWQRLQRRLPALLENQKPVVSRVRSPIGRRGIYAVRIGADDRAEALGICERLRQAGGACIVAKNR